MSVNQTKFIVRHMFTYLSSLLRPTKPPFFQPSGAVCVLFNILKPSSMSPYIACPRVLFTITYQRPKCARKKNTQHVLNWLQVLLNQHHIKSPFDITLNQTRVFTVHELCPRPIHCPNCPRLPQGAIQTATYKLPAPITLP
jgi:hypothetical protein